MNIVIFSDIHGNQYSFQKFIEIVAELNAAEIWFLGDLIGYYYGSSEILAEFRRRNIQQILGNHDQYFLDMVNGKRSVTQLCARYGQSYRIALNQFSKEDVQYLAQLPTKIERNFDGTRILATHGAPWDQLEGRVYPDTDPNLLDKWCANYDFMFLGHTHHQMSLNVSGCQVINPGSLGQQRDGKGCSFLILDTESGLITRLTVNYDIELLKREILSHDPERSEFIEVLTRPEKIKI